jgi:hypothetical protein
MTIQSDLRSLKQDVKTLAQAVEELADVVESMLKGELREYAVNEVSQVTHTARRIANSL